jgi:hypothetical protein
MLIGRTRNLMTNGGHLSPEQIVLTTPNGEYFFSYGCEICFRSNDRKTVIINKTYYRYSHTTSKYLSQFLALDSKEIASYLRRGDFKLRKMS